MKLSKIFMLIALLGFISNPLWAQQNNGKDKKENSQNKNKQKSEKEKESSKDVDFDQANKQKDKDKEKDKEKYNDDQVDMMSNDDDNNGQGNAYGRNKNGLEGKEFGQERARQAKLNKEKKAKDLDRSIERGKEKAKAAADRIKKADDDLEQNKEQGTIFGEAYDKEKAKIEAAKAALENLKQELIKAEKNNPFVKVVDNN